ncbi:MAG: hypothetical protein ACP5MC_03165, partial [Candidatus Micrarchaeia archaeon]
IEVNDRFNDIFAELAPSLGLDEKDVLIVEVVSQEEAQRLQAEDYDKLVGPYYDFQSKTLFIPNFYQQVYQAYAIYRRCLIPHSVF